MASVGNEIDKGKIWNPDVGEDEMTTQQAYERALPFLDFLDATEVNRELWHSMASRAPLHEQALNRIRYSPGSWRLLVLADD